jgi:HEAT repeat protein
MNGKHRHSLGPRLRPVLLVALALAVPALAGHASDVDLSLVMYEDPKIEIPAPVMKFSPGLKPLWLEALARPEVELQRQAAQTIAMAHRRGMADLADTAGPLMAALDAPDQHRIVKLAAAQTLIALDARQAAAVLFAHGAGEGLDMAEVVEPALARWLHEPIRQEWIKRVSNPSAVRRQLLVLAIRGLGEVGETEAAPHLLELAVGRDVAPEVRMEAARATAALRSEGLEDAARRLAADASPQKIVDRLVAASLLTGHQSNAAQQLLLELAVDREPTVAAIALGRLLEIDPMLVIPIVERVVASHDANVRHLGAQALVAWRTPEAIAQLGPMLDDRHPDVRSYVRRSLLEMAPDPQLGAPVLDEVLKMLAGERWRGLEQASLAVVALDHKPAAGRLVELLEFERPEVFVTAAWGLRRLAVAETLDAMLDKAKRVTEQARTVGYSSIHVGRQLCHLIEAFGQMNHKPSDPLLREYIPKGSPFGLEPRAAAIWTLGHLHAGKPDPKLATLFAGRLSDVNPMDPEVPEVRWMSAIGLGRMKAEGQLSTLRKFMEIESVNCEVGYACAWAIHEITGEAIPEPEAHHGWRLGWFLEPIAE